MIAVITQTKNIAVCGCAATASTLLGYLWLGVSILFIMIIAIGIDIYYIWQRCNERKRRLAALAARRAGNGYR